MIRINFYKNIDNHEDYYVFLVRVKLLQEKWKVIEKFLSHFPTVNLYNQKIKKSRIMKVEVV